MKMAVPHPRMFSVIFILCGVISLTKVASTTDAVIMKNVTPEQWMEAATGNRKFLLVFYKTKGCQSCKMMMDVVTEMVGDPDLDEDLQVGTSKDTSLASDLGVSSYPAVVFLRENSHVIYDGKPVTEQLMEWLELSRSKVTQHLNDDSFEHLTQASSGATTGDWLVAFYQERCQRVLTTMESAGVRIRQKTNVAVVDTSKNKMLEDRFSVKKCPEVILFKQGKMYRYELPQVDQTSLNAFVEAWYRNSKAEQVLPPKSKFDFLTEGIADSIKTQMNGKNRVLVIAALCGLGAFILIVLVCCCRSVAGSNKKHKTE